MEKILRKDLIEVLIANFGREKDDQYSIKELSVLTGYSYYTISNLKVDLYLTKKKLRLSYKEIADYSTEHLEMTMLEIADHLKYSLSTVAKAMKKYGVSRTPIGGSHEQNSVVVE